MSERTTISLSKDNHDKLAQKIKFGQTFDDIISTLLREMENP